jgi:hypothetical protein
VRASDRAIGIVIGILLGLAIVIGFVFLGSGETIDDPSLNEGEQTQQEAPAVAPEQPAPGQPSQQPAQGQP